jgi:hypothetical protein
MGVTTTMRSCTASNCVPATRQDMRKNKSSLQSAHCQCHVEGYSRIVDGENVCVPKRCSINENDAVRQEWSLGISSVPDWRAQPSSSSNTGKVSPKFEFLVRRVQVQPVRRG